MNFFTKLARAVPYLPIINIPFRAGGEPVVRNASLGGLHFAIGFLVAAGLIGYFWFVKWYRQHPVWGKIILVVVGIWVLWQLIRWVRSLCDDPYSRTTPYRTFEVPLEPGDGQAGGTPKTDNSVKSD